MILNLKEPKFSEKIIDSHDAKMAGILPRPIVMTNGVFDILHRGHATYLAQAKSLGKSLVVAVNSDSSVRLLNKGDDRPINCQEDRAALLAALSSVDMVIIFDDKVPIDVMKQVRPDIYIKGGDYDVAKLPEAKIASDWGCKSFVINFLYPCSTTKLINKIRNN